MMEDVTSGTAPAPSAEAARLAVVVETELTAERTSTAAARTAQAAAIYAAWRNAHLGALPGSAFDLVQAASGDLIAAIAAAL